MNWIEELLWGNSVAHTIIILSFVIIIGSLLGRIKIKGITLGSTMVLFLGIAASHFGFNIDPNILNFAKDFALIFFVYAIGLQVGPGFIASFKRGGIPLNLLAIGVILVGVITTIIIHYATGTPMSTMVGIMSGASTSTTGLAAAEETFTSINNGIPDPSIALGYAVTYPFGILGVILVLAVLKSILRVNIDKERQEVVAEEAKLNIATNLLSLKVENPAIFGKTIHDLITLVDRNFIISRVKSSVGKITLASSNTTLNEGDVVFVTTSPSDVEMIMAFIGRSVDMTTSDWTKLDTDLLSRKLIVTKPSINGKTLSQINLRNRFGVTITRINRAGVELIAQPDLELHLGDRVMVVGTKEGINGAKETLGNEVQRLNAPNIIPIFIGITLGVILGSIPFAFPGIPQPVKLGLSGGMIIIAMLMSVFGPRLKLATYTTTSANLMIREIGITIFLACVGLASGGGFVDTLIKNDGLTWVLMGAVITIVPIVVVGVFARSVMKYNYLKIMGFIAGCTAGPPALDYATSTANNNAPLISYAAVYPLTMFLRVMVAQLMILAYA